MSANPLNLVDSSGWIEFFIDGPNAGTSAGLLPPEGIPFATSKWSFQRNRSRMRTKAGLSQQT